MRLNITTKLFLGVLATSVLVALVMAVAGQWAFQRDFRRYVAAAEERRAEAAVDTLAAMYAETGDWQRLAGAERRWLSVLRGNSRLRGMEPPEPGPRPRHGLPRAALYDADGALVVGRPAAPGEETLRLPVVVDGETVGWLVRAPQQRLTDAADLRFQQAQLRNLAIASLAAVLLAALAAALLSRTFLAPARAIGAASHRLAAGELDTRVEVRSGDEFGRLADDFNLLARTLQHNEAMRRRMMADVAHELRTPLAVIRAELDAVEDGVRTLGPDTVTSLQAEARALGKLVDDLYQLALSDLGALDYRRRDLELRTLVGETLQPLRERCAAAGLALDTSGLEGAPLPVHADPDRLAQLVANLVANAIRYTDAPGRIEIACRREQGHAVLEVSDSAPGVPDAALLQLFDRFFRVEDSRSRASGGAGLGLAICRNIVEAHDGTIAATASGLGGVAITVRLPLLRSQA